MFHFKGEAMSCYNYPPFRQHRYTEKEAYSGRTLVHAGLEEPLLYTRPMQLILYMLCLL